ncbi:hypothetical protein BDV38DRAFT_259541 [Aspergillus pseudotamarii]|uniref:Uncharacterized protein n=1 Tax=Aspergillus pseudotamarii TaxID=132259 RepID=A0A5N6SEH1_ASPPS|nr:uncharacterized protein BDV38DRAFT_259541 [Aspergillus pseudotamarii]KAE8133062.1 hypothetical protein BDV38DRAFT_259541 [Aspergillus pseudotamarii]
MLVHTIYLFSFSILKRAEYVGSRKSYHEDTGEGHLQTNCFPSFLFYLGLFGLIAAVRRYAVMLVNWGELGYMQAFLRLAAIKLPRSWVYLFILF